MNATIALPLSSLPPTLRREELQSSSPVVDVAAACAAGTVEETLSGMKEFTCVKPGCGAVFTAFMRGLCPACYESALELEIHKKSGPLQFNKTFPPRAIAATSSMTGPALAKARDLLPRLRGTDPRTRGCLLIVLGDRGTGKTVMATYWAGMIGTGRYVKVTDLFRAVRGTFASDSKTTEAEILQTYEKADFLVIDEAQERKKDSEWESVLLTNLIDKRYDRFKPTAIIANLAESAVDEYLGASIVSRATRSGGGLVVCDWPPYA